MSACATILIRSPKTLSSQKKTLCPLAVTLLSLSLLQLLETTKLLSTFMHLPILGVLDKWNYRVWGLLCLASFT